VSRSMTNHSTYDRWVRVPLSPSYRDLRLSNRRALPAMSIHLQSRLVPRMTSAIARACICLGAAKAADPHLRDIEDLARLAHISVDGIVSMLAAEQGRVIAGFAHNGRLVAVAKIGDPADLALLHEIDILHQIRRYRPDLPSPRVLWDGPWSDKVALVTAATNGVKLGDLKTALALCIQFGDSSRGRPIVHGDLAPANLLLTPGHDLVIDWERARWQWEPLFDLAHFVIQTGVLTSRLTPRQALHLLLQDSSPGSEYAAALGVSREAYPDHLLSYLDRADREVKAGQEFRESVRRLLDTEQY
jgi:hypothetical protein